MVDIATITERRQRPRVRSKWSVAVKAWHSQIEGEVQNISPIGAFICFKEPPPLKGSFSMTIKVDKFRELNVIGKVIWSTIFTPDKGEPCLGVGVQFEHISEEDSRFLHDLVVSFYVI